MEGGGAAGLLQPRRPRSGLLAQRQALIARQLGDGLGSSAERWKTAAAEPDSPTTGSLADQAVAHQALRRLGMAAAPTEDIIAAVPRTWDTEAEQWPELMQQQTTTAARHLRKGEALTKLAQFTRLVRQLRDEDRAEVTREAVEEVDALVREAGLAAPSARTPRAGTGRRRSAPLQAAPVATPAPAPSPRDQQQAVWVAVPAPDPEPPAPVVMHAASPGTQRRTRAAAATETRATAAARVADIYANMYEPQPINEPAYADQQLPSTHSARSSPASERVTREEQDTDELVECANCRRTFLPQRYSVHLRGCRPGHAARPVGMVRCSMGAAAGGGASAARASIQALSEAFARLPPPSPSPSPKHTLHPASSSAVLVDTAPKAAAVTRMQQQMEEWVDYFSYMPDEIKLDILTYVGPPFGEASSLGAMARTCRWFSRLWCEAVSTLTANDSLFKGKSNGGSAPHMQYSAVMWRLVDSCSSTLCEIELGGCRTLELIDPSTPCPLVHTLGLRGCAALRDVEALGNPTLWPRLRTLDCTQCRSLSIGLLAAALTRALSIQTLNLSGTRALQSLSELSAPMAAEGDEWEQQQQQQHQEEEQALDGGSGDEEHGFLPGLLPRLRSLDLACCRQLVDVSDLAQCEQLLFLSLRECRAVASLRGLGGCTQLKELVLNGCRSLDPSALREVGLCGNLERLSIANCRALPDIEGLRGCTRLARLDLGGCRALRNLNALSDARASLTWLNLSGCEKLADISALADSRCLHTINLSFCSGLAEIAALSSCANLASVELSFATSLMDAWPLANCGNLESATLTGCRALPVDFVAKLGRAKPGLAIKR